jgi:phosphonatase-like hydrolase
MRKYELVVFDMAGTTLKDDDAVGDSLRAALMTAGVRVPREEVNAVMGMPKPVAIQKLLERSTSAQTRVNQQLAASIHQSFLRQMLEYYRSNPAVDEIPGASAAFHWLRLAGVMVALDTGFSRDIVDVILRRMEWSNPDLVNASVASDEVLHGRPHPDLILRAMELTQVRDASRVVKVGDTPADLNEGTNAGCGLVIGVTYGTHTREELVVHPHTHLVDSLSEVVDLILHQNTCSFEAHSA